MSLVASLLTLASLESTTINCLGPLSDEYEAMICLYMIDPVKLKRVDCTKQPLSERSKELCEAVIVPRLNITIDCLKPQSNQDYDFLCRTVPKPETISFIDCLEDLEDGYEANLCSAVDMEWQQALRERL